MEFKRIILYCLVCLIIGLGVGISLDLNGPTTFVKDFNFKEAVKNEPCKIVVQSGDEYFYFDGFCYQYENLFENSTRLRKILKLEGV